MRRLMVATIGALPIVAFFLLPKPATAETGLQKPFLNPVVVADRRDDDHRRDNDDHDRDWRNRDGRDRDWRNRYDRRDSNTRYDDRRRDNPSWSYDRRGSNRRVWIPGHWESGFLGIGRKWVEGHYENR